MMMHAYGRCQICGGEGALWRIVVIRRLFWFFGPKVKKGVLACDECCHLDTPEAGGGK